MYVSLCTEARSQLQVTSSTVVCLVLRQDLLLLHELIDLARLSKDPPVSTPQSWLHKYGLPCLFGCVYVYVVCACLDVYILLYVQVCMYLWRPRD